MKLLHAIKCCLFNNRLSHDNNKSTATKQQ